MHLKEGKDVLYLACSSGLSASLNTARMLAEGELKEKYPNNRVIVLDTLRAGMSLGMIVMRAQELKDEGKSLDEVAEIIEQEKLSYKEIGIPETLTYLRRAGRVSAGAAFFGKEVIPFVYKPLVIHRLLNCIQDCLIPISVKRFFKDTSRRSNGYLRQR